MNIERVTPAGRPTGMLCCPDCGHQLGRADNPATGYLTRCSLCGISLSVRIDGPAILIAVKK
jgi:transcription elongation factor Elf1